MSRKVCGVHILKNLPVTSDLDSAVSLKCFSKYSIKRSRQVSYLPNEILEYVFKKSIGRVKEEDLQDILFLKKVTSLVLEKMQRKDSHLPLWTTEDYFDFRDEMRLFTKEQLEFSKTTLLRCLSLSSIEVMEILDRIARIVDFYPGVERLFLPDLNLNFGEKKYKIQTKEMKEIDIYHLIGVFNSKFLSFVHKEAIRLCASFDDCDILCQILLEIKEEISDDRRVAILTPFYEEFYYLRENPIFIDLYIQYQHRYIDMLRKNCFEIYRSMKAKSSLERKLMKSEAYYKIEKFGKNQKRARR